FRCRWGPTSGVISAQRPSSRPPQSWQLSADSSWPSGITWPAPSPKRSASCSAGRRALPRGDRPRPPRNTLQRPLCPERRRPGASPVPVRFPLTASARGVNDVMRPFDKVIVLGLDGLEPKIVDRLLCAGELPHLARLRAEGGYGRVATTCPAQTPVAWSTFATGTNPGGHGIFDFIRRDPVTRLPDLRLNRY